MKENIALILFGCAIYLCTINGFEKHGNDTCSCSNPEWCKPINRTAEKEVFVFSVRNDESHWKHFDWDVLTTVVMFGYLNQSLMCLAHSHGVKVVMLANNNKKTMLSPKLRKEWVDDIVEKTEANFLDGINFDFEEEVLKNDSAVREAYTLAVAETYSALKSRSLHYQITVDVAWKPNVDSRFYGYRNLSEVTDFLFVMAYDEQSQIYGDCVAGPNSGLDRAKLGLETYIMDPSYNIDPRKLVLGVPWYGYVYQCLQLSGELCFIKKVPFRGVACSDAAGRQYDYGYLYKTLMTMPEAYTWNTSSSTPYFTHSDWMAGTIHQVQFDDPHSLSLKYKLAQVMGLRGVGVWNIDSLDYTDTAMGEDIRRKMFGALADAWGAR